MSNGATAQVVSLDAYRRARTPDRRTAPMQAPQVSTAPVPAMWIVWVPVWFW